MGGGRPDRRASKRLSAGRSPRTSEAAHGLGEALEPGRPELAQLEHLAQEPARAVRDHHGTRRGRLLQPRGQVRRLADHRLLAGGTLADEVAHDHEAGRDADPRRERLPGRGGEPADGLGDRQARPHGTLGVVLVRAGPAEVGQHAVAHELGDVPAEARDLARDGVLVGAQDLAHLLGVEPAAQRGRADQVAEHHRELSALGRGGRCCAGRHRHSWRRRRGCGLVAQRGDRREQLGRGPSGQAELLQVARP